MYGNEPFELLRRIVAVLCRCCENLLLNIVEERIGRVLVDLIGSGDIVIVDGLEHRLDERSILRVLLQQHAQHGAAVRLKCHCLLQSCVECFTGLAVLA
ncbi:hypothetical protein PQQ87_00960 [Paraburkholderia nemoris]|uniref:hypothetical protein n=1 Tax=Paraburkholderia nemoris TaxID=2793076 RepID=UPI0038B935D1